MVVVVVALVVVVAALAALLWRSKRSASQQEDTISAALRRGGIVSSGENPATAIDAAFGELEQRATDAERIARRDTSALQAAEFGVVIVDAAGEVVFANVAAERYLGARHGDAVAEIRIREIMKQVATERRAIRREVDVYTPTRRLLGLHAVPIDDAASSPGGVVFVEDLTERHRVNAIRRDFVSNASHELKTPLGAISVLAQTLAEADEPGVQRRLAGRLESEAGRMSRLIDDVLDLALIDGDPYSHHPVAVDAILNDAVGQVSVSADQYGISIETKAAGDDVLIAGDRRQLVSAVAALLENAVKYTHVLDPNAGGTVWLRAMADVDTATFEVEDHGIGIPEQHQDRIFERFYRVDQARSRETGGTGLGLAIARHVARNHDADIEVDSTAGAGSTFRITLQRWRG